MCYIQQKGKEHTRLFPYTNLSTNGRKDSTVDQSFDCKKIITKVGEPKPIIYIHITVKNIRENSKQILLIVRITTAVLHLDES